MEDTIREVKTHLGMDQASVEEARAAIEQNLKTEESKSVQGLSTQLELTQWYISQPPSSIPDEDVDKIKRICGTVSEFLPYARKCSFLLQEVEGSESLLNEVRKELGSMNSLLKKLHGQGLFARLFLLCTLRSVVANLTRQIERVQEPVNGLDELKVKLREQLEKHILEESRKMLEAKAIEKAEQSEETMDKLAQALGV